jgi:hypothetical protein
MVYYSKTWYAIWYLKMIIYQFMMIKY